MTLDQLAEQAATLGSAVPFTDAYPLSGDYLLIQVQKLLRQIPAAVQVQREQLEQAQAELSEARSSQAQLLQEATNVRVIARDSTARAEQAEQQLAQVMQERDAAISRALMAEEARDLWHERFSETLRSWGELKNAAERATGATT